MIQQVNQRQSRVQRVEKELTAEFVWKIRMTSIYVCSMHTHTRAYPLTFPFLLVHVKKNNFKCLQAEYLKKYQKLKSWKLIYAKAEALKA